MVFPTQLRQKLDAFVVRDFYKKFYNSLGIVPNRCSSSIGKTRGLLSFYRGIGKQVNLWFERLLLLISLPCHTRDDMSTLRVSFAASLMTLAKMFNIESASLVDMTFSCVATPYTTLDLNASVASPMSNLCWEEQASRGNTLQSLHALRSPHRTNK
ncbi:hypothetical protein Tco_0973979 [Tanacetum coccineum]|uniref:Uncharacterized protein n=1 Tax=Tanacetum coccineum TaxID=301880 RepID=A0ABQ5EAD1_9ASTR